MKKRYYLLCLSSMLASMTLTPVSANAKINYLPIKKATAWSSTFVYEKPDTSSNRLGDTIRNKTYDVYSQVSNSDNTVDFYCIKTDKGYVYAPVFNFEQIDIYTNKIVNANTIQAHTFISLEGNIREQSYKDLVDTYVLLPAYIRELFQIEGFKIRMTEKYIAEEAFKGYNPWNGGYLNGVFDYEKKILFVNDENARHVLHEMGHYVNDRLGMFSDREENKKLFNEESYKISTYAKNNNREYFAECFDQYYRCPQILKKQSPRSYEMIETALNDFKFVSYPILNSYWGEVRYK